jgi:2-oxoglutarate dehydrogenase E1 component
LVKEFIWVQEEPKNQGAWTFIHPLLSSLLPNRELIYIGRTESASPAVGSLLVHQHDQKDLLERAFASL